MRLFVGIDFNDETIKLIESTISKLEGIAEKGRFVRPELIHLTVEFLGEIEPGRVTELQELMKGIKFEPFYIKPTGLGTFKRREGDILWIGVEENQELQLLWDKLHNTLKDAGFKVEERPYIPHITLGRKVRLSTDILEIESNMSHAMPETLVDRVHIFHSTSKNGRLEYIRIYSGEVQK